MRTLVWFRGKDLRLCDHAPLTSALGSGDVLPLFVLDPYFFAPARARNLPHRVQFLLESIAELARAIAIAEVVAAQAPLGVYATLASSRAAIPSAEIAAVERLMPDLQPIMKSADVQEGLRAFMERRPGTFEGR